jgi:pteridine reductase
LSTEQPLAGKTALVTGGAARVGAAIVRALHGAGAHVVIHYRSSEKPAVDLRAALEAERAQSVTLVQSDLLEVSRLDGIAAQALAATGRLDVLVNNASSYYPTPIGDADERDWDDLFGSNAKAPFFLSQALAPALRQTSGAIVNLVDIHAERPHAQHTVYCMAKAANAMLVKSLARELAPEVRVNGVSPGAILWPEEYFSDEKRLKILERIPLGRPGDPEAIAAAVRFLATADYVTGQILAVDGGRTIQQ